mmetsp:Transcript_35200/g.81113  ORF Transcript_35200/g.81113 Transcript_35200/m.81113 type:complete len:996 (+) Transcript_35200:75-3062(+)
MPRSVAFACRLQLITYICCLCTQVVMGGGSHSLQQVFEHSALAPRRELLRKETRRERRETDRTFTVPLAFQQYKFSVLKTRGGGGTARISEFTLADDTTQALNLKDPTVASEVAVGSVDGVGMDDPMKCIDGDTSTGLDLTSGQYILLKMHPGVLVGGFGFKTAGEEFRGSDPVDFQLEGSMDGNDWFILNVKADYETPDERGGMVGPFVVSRLSAMALLGNRTLPEAAVAVAASTPAPSKLPFEVPQTQAASVPTPVASMDVAPESEPQPVSEETKVVVQPEPEAADIVQEEPAVIPQPDSTVPEVTQVITQPEIVPAEAQIAEAGTKVEEAVVEASQANGLATADAAAVSAAVSVASEAAKEESPDTPSKVADAARAIGLSADQVANVVAALKSVTPDHLDNVLHAWTAAASAKAVVQTTLAPEAKVAAVVAATGDAGFTVEQQALAAAESAVPAALKALAEVSTTAPLSAVGKALAGTELSTEDKAAVADAAAAEAPENQKAVADVLAAAGILATTTTVPPEPVDLDDPNVKLVMEEVTHKLEGVAVSEQQKARIVNAAAAALMKASTTPFDGVGMIVQAAEEAGFSESQVMKIAAEAPMVPAGLQAAVATALSAAGDGVQVLKKKFIRPAQKVAAVVKAEAAAGMDDAEQATSAAIAVANAAAATKQLESAQSEAGLFKQIVAAAKKAHLSTEQVEAILAAVAPMSAEDQVAVLEHLEEIEMGPVPETTKATTTLPSVTLDMLPSVETTTQFFGQNDAGRMPSTSTVPVATHSKSAQFMFSVVPSLESSRASYKDQTGLEAKGFLFEVGLDTTRIVEMLREKTGFADEASDLSVAYGRFEFDWPVTSCSDQESGFTDFQSITFYNATFSNPGDECGTLVASTVDTGGAIRFPLAGDLDLFWLAGQFGTNYHLTGGDKVLLSMLDLVIVAFVSGTKVEYSLCGDETLASYVGCPTQSLLKIKYPENNLGQGVKICSGQAHFHEYKLENCFTV